MTKAVLFNRGRKGDVVGYALPSDRKVLFPKGFSPEEGSLHLCRIDEPEGKTFGFAYPAHDVKPDRTTEHLASISGGRPPYAILQGTTVYLPDAEPSTRPVHIRVEWFGTFGIGEVLGDPLAEVEALRKQALQIEWEVQDRTARLKTRYYEVSIERAKRNGDITTKVERTVGNEPIDRSEDVFDRAPTGRWRPFVCEREVIVEGRAVMEKIRKDAERVARRYRNTLRVKLSQIASLREQASKLEDHIKEAIGGGL